MQCILGTYMLLDFTAQAGKSSVVGLEVCCHAGMHVIGARLVYH